MRGLFILKFSRSRIARRRFDPRGQLLNHRGHFFQPIRVLQDDFIERVVVILQVHQRGFQFGDPLLV